MLAEVAARAAAERVSYLELMLTPNGAAPIARGRAAGWDADLGRFRDKLLAARASRRPSPRRAGGSTSPRRGSGSCCAAARRDADAGARSPSATSRRSGGRACRSRCSRRCWPGSRSRRRTRASSAFNLVQPEDDPTAVRDFSLHMRMIDFLHGKYPHVPDRAARRRARRGTGAARSAALPHPRLGPHRARAPHRPRRRRHARGRRAGSAPRDGVEAGPRRGRAEQRRPDPRRQGQAPSAGDVSQVRRAGRARHRRCRRRAIDA